MSSSRQFRFQYVGGPLALLASGSQTTLFDHDVATTWDVQAGAISTVAWKMAIEVNTDTGAGTLHPIIHFFVIPAGVAVPTTTTSNGVSDAAQFHWMSVFPTFVAERGGDSTYMYTAVPRSTRRFNKGDRLVAVLFNPGGGGAFGATAIFQGHYEVLYKAAG